MFIEVCLIQGCPYKEVPLYTSAVSFFMNTYTHLFTFVRSKNRMVPDGGLICVGDGGREGKQ